MVFANLAFVCLFVFVQLPYPNGSYSVLIAFAFSLFIEIDGRTKIKTVKTNIFKFYSCSCALVAMIGGKLTVL